MTTGGYPLRVTGRPDPHVSRWLWLVKWLLLLPHVLCLAVLGIGYAVCWLVSLVAVVVTGRYPRGTFDYMVGVMRWAWRVSFYGYSALGTDRYPPFTLADVPDYPARLDVDYPERLDRGLALIKWWLLAIPHYLIVGIFTSAGGTTTWREGQADYRSGVGVIGLLVVVAAFVLLVTGSYPRRLFDLLMALNRWVLRVGVYASLMTDRYPPFRFDDGPEEPSALPVPTAPPTGPAYPAPPPA